MAITIENSPRAISTVPARTRPRGPTPARPAAIHPVATLAIDVTTREHERPAAATSTRSPGSIWNEKNRKNVAANRSRSGPISVDGAVLGVTRQGEADEERADRGGHLELLRQSADEQGEAEHREQQRLVEPPASDVAEVRRRSAGRR